MIAALLLAAATPVAARVDAVAVRSGLAGEVLVAKGDEVLLDKGYGTVDPKGGATHQAGARWRLASITKQVTATRVVSDLASMTTTAEPIDHWLDSPFIPIHDGVTPNALTFRQMLTHHSLLPNPDQSRSTTDGVPEFYKRPTPDIDYCFGHGKSKFVGTARFSYNNCDYILLGANSESLHRAKPLNWPGGMDMAKPGEIGVPGFVGGKAEPHYELASFGAAGGLIGTARAVFAFDRGLMTGKLLSPAARAELWKPEGGRSYQALGQWVFPGKLRGCTAPKRIVQRDGEIGGVQTRNYILPDDDLVVVVFTNRGSDDFPIGEIWQGKGFAYDLLSAAACTA